jgi:hypothetical protein
MSQSKASIRVIHFFNLFSRSDYAFPHEITAVANEMGFIYLSNVMSDEQANVRSKRLIERVSRKKSQREEEGHPFDVDDYIKISQIGMNNYFVKSGNNYPEEMAFDEVVELERAVLLEKRVDRSQAIEQTKSSKSIDLFEKPFIGSLTLPQMTPGIMADVEQVLMDYPDLLDELDSGADIHSSGMIELIFALVGSIHPDDPNGWVLDYLDEFGNLKEATDE